MKPEDVVGRARRAIGHAVPYILGAGGMDPNADFPFVTPEKGCDCSGFAMWCLGFSREVDGVWYGTDQIVADATGAGVMFHAVTLEQAIPGDLIVYPHQKPGHHGHVGVVSQCEGGKPIRAIHCSIGNWSIRHDAIQEGGVGPWTMVPNMVIARAKALEVAP